MRDTLQAWVVTGAADGHGLVDDAVLLTSELVTNAVVHAGTPVQVTCRLADGAVEVVVSDGHPGRLVPEAPEREAVPSERTGGRGLLLPAALASAWGVAYGRASKAVWFRLALDGASGELGGRSRTAMATPRANWPTRSGSRPLSPPRCVSPSPWRPLAGCPGRSRRQRLPAAAGGHGRVRLALPSVPTRPSR